MRNKFKDYAWMTVGALLMGLGVYFFEFPNHFSTGGVTGISILLAEVFPAVSPGLFMLVINVLLLIIGFIIIGRDFGFKTVYCSLLISGVSYVLEFIYPLTGPLTNDTLLELVFAVFLPGVGAAIMFNVSASSGGTDIVALILKKYTSLNVGQALLASDFVIAASTFFVYDVKTGLFSLLGLFAKVFVVDDILDSINMCKAFTIITTKPDEIDNYIMTELRHGATTYGASGAYTGEGRTVILTVCRRAEAIRLRKRVKEIDPHSFIIITKTSEIMGKGFRDNTN